MRSSCGTMLSTSPLGNASSLGRLVFGFPTEMGDASCGSGVLSGLCDERLWGLVCVCERKDIRSQCRSQCRETKARSVIPLDMLYCPWWPFTSFY